ncbi:ATP-binding protein [Candidatus Saccharibacteria bacterium]|nr:ATP-binding protein [Candidatus Saccharibacteria bacterium]
MSTPLSNPVLILVRGMPGSGKSYLTAKLQAMFDAHDVVVLDPDATDYTSPEYAAHVAAQTAEGVDPALHAYRFLRAQAYDAIAAKKAIIWNQPFTNRDIFRKMMARLHDHAAAHDTTLKVIIVEVNVDPALAKQRVAARKAAGGHGPSENTLKNRIDAYESFASEGYETISVSGDGDPNAVSRDVVTRLKLL